MFRLQFGHTATKIVAPIAAAAALFAGSVTASAQALSSLSSFNPAAFGFTVPAATGPVAPAPQASASVQGIINQTNAQRVANGLAPLRVDPNLTNLAQDWANTLSRDGNTPGTARTTGPTTPPACQLVARTSSRHGATTAMPAWCSCGWTPPATARTCLTPAPSPWALAWALLLTASCTPYRTLGARV